MELTLLLKTSELNSELLDMIKKLYKKKKVCITIKDANELDEMEYLLASEANREYLLNAIKSYEGYEFLNDEFDKILKGQKPDLSKIKKVKIKK